MNDLKTMPRIRTGWPEVVPRVAQMLIARTPKDEDNDELIDQLDAAGLLLASDRFARVADYFQPGELDGVKTVALLLTVGMAAGERVDALFSALTSDERYLALKYADEIEDAVLFPPARHLLAVPSMGSTAVLRVEPVSQALAAASPAHSSQQPGIQRFRVITTGAVAEVEARLGGGPVNIRQTHGPRLRLAGQHESLPRRDVLAVEVDDGTDLARWLESALCLTDDDSEPTQRP